MNYHAHIYWKNSHERDLALSFRTILDSIGGELGSIHDKNVGPHQYPMYQVKYSNEIKETLENFLIENHKELSILLHEDTGNDLHDHTKNVRWLGEELNINLDAFK